MKTLFAVRYKKDRNIYMGVDYYKRGDVYFPTYLCSDDEPDNDLISDKVYVVTDEYMNDTWNQHTLLWEMKMWSELPKTGDNVFAQPVVEDKYGVIKGFNFNRDEWEVVELKLSFRVVRQNY